jgi:hypothetical protein
VRRAVCIAALGLVLVACGQDAQSGAVKRQNDANRPSIGFIDIPANGATVDTPVRVSGWALDESGVVGVRIFFDDELMVTAPLVTPRPDLDKLYPALKTPGSVAGFESVIDAGAHAGYTVIRAVAIDGKGAQTQIYSVTVKILE